MVWNNICLICGHAFTQFYRSEDLDASLLVVMPLVFFMAPTDPRMLGTINAILKNPRDGGLLSDSLVYRYPPQPRIDGLPGEEGTFNMCSFWLVEALTRSGLAFPEKLDQARLLFARVCWAMPIISGSIQNRQGPKARRWVISLRPLHISR